jgi:hypothetical protein
VHPSAEVEAELTRRHKSTSTTVLGLIVAAILLAVVAYLGRPYFTERPSQDLSMVVRIVGGVLAMGSIVWRRNKFSTMRLKDIGALQGATGLLRTLEKTTLQVAFLGAVIGTIGFVSTLITGNETLTYWASIIALVLLLYCYPTKNSWRKAVLYFADTRADGGVGSRQ